MKYLNIGCGSNFHSDWINLDLYKSKYVTYHNIKKKLPFLDNSVDVIYHSHVLEHLTKEEANKFIKDCFRVLKPDGVMRVVVPDLEQIVREYLLNLEKGFASMNREATLNYNWNKIEMLDQIIRKDIGGDVIKVIKSGEFNKEYIEKRNGDEVVKIIESINREKGLKGLLFEFIKKRKLVYDFLSIFIKKINPQKSGEAHKWMYDKLDLRILLESVGFKNFSIMNYNQSDIKDWLKYSLDKSSLGDFSRKPDSLFVEVKK